MVYSTSGGLTLTIKPDEIEKIEYIHGLQPVEHITQAKNRTKADFIINANFFVMATGKTQGEVVDEGKVLSTGMNPYGYAFVDKKKPVFSYKNNVNAVDFIGGYPCLLRNGTVASEATRTISGIDYAKKRGRTAIGMTANGEFVIRVIPDSLLYPRKTIPQMVTEMKRLGCVNAINLDGGGSSQYISPKGGYNSGRRVDGFIAVWLKAVPTEKQRPVLRRGSKGEAVKEMQGVVGVSQDGSFGPITDKAVRNFQRTNGLVADGSVGPLTWAKIDEVK